MSNNEKIPLWKLPALLALVRAIENESGELRREIDDTYFNHDLATMLIARVLRLSESLKTLMITGE